MKCLLLFFKVFYILFFTTSIAHGATYFGPIKLRNLNPMISIFGVPTWPDYHLEEGSIGFVTERASHFQLADVTNESIRQDGETHRNILIIKKKIANNAYLDLQIPQIVHTGGSLDDFIDGWHKAFSMPDGNRSQYPEDLMNISYAIDGSKIFHLTNTVKGLGDIQLNYRKEFIHDQSILSIGVKMPTGDYQNLFGSGYTDFSISYFKRIKNDLLSSNYRFFWGLGLLKTGQSKMFGNKINYIGLGIFGLNYRVFENLVLKAQMDIHSPFYNSVLNEFKTSIQGNLGLLYRFSDNKDIALSIGEDLIVRTAPDVTLNVDFQWNY